MLLYISTFHGVERLLSRHDVLHNVGQKLSVPHLARQLGMYIACVLTASLGVHCRRSKGSTGRLHSIPDSVL